MDRSRKHAALLLPAFLLLACLLLTSCVDEGASASPSGSPPATPNSPATPTVPAEPVETVDYAASIKLDMSSETAKQEATVKSFVDGDTVHFHVPESVMADGVLKARFLGLNTPESTGKIEEYGKAASRFTKETLSKATSIILESETDKWSPDSTGGRYLVWVWYKTADTEEYRNLNIELLQNGLAAAYNSFGNRYGETCMAAINQAKREMLNIYSGQPDPDFYYGDAIELTLKELRLHPEDYEGTKVAFHGVVTSNSGTQGVYIEDHDPETDLYFGMYAYYGYGLTGAGLDALSVGNEVRVVGTVQYYEAGGTWQVSDLSYRLMQPDDPNNVQKLSDGHSPAYVLTDPDTFVNGEAVLETEEGEFRAPSAQLALATSVEMKGLTVTHIYTTDNEDSSSKGAMTLTCEKDGLTVTVRTAVLRDKNGALITADLYQGKTIDVKGIVDFFDGTYQIKVFTADNITIY